MKRGIQSPTFTSILNSSSLQVKPQMRLAQIFSSNDTRKEGTLVGIVLHVLHLCQYYCDSEHDVVYVEYEFVRQAQTGTDLRFQACE